MKAEKMCDDGAPCTWISEEEYDEEGDSRLVTFCSKCFRYKNKVKEKISPPEDKNLDQGRIL